MVVRQRRRPRGPLLLPLLLPCARAECLIEPNALGHVVIPAGMETIPVGAFDGCSSLKSIDFPPRLRAIEAYAFSSSGLESLNLQNTDVRTIGMRAFYKCTRIEGHLELPPSLQEIGSEAFFGCRDIRWADISVTGVTSIGFAAFERCASLQAVAFPTTLRHVDGDAFKGTPAEFDCPDGPRECGPGTFCGVGFSIPALCP